MAYRRCFSFPSRVSREYEGGYQRIKGILAMCEQMCDAPTITEMGSKAHAAREALKAFRPRRVYKYRTPEGRDAFDPTEHAIRVLRRPIDARTAQEAFLVVQIEAVIYWAQYSLACEAAGYYPLWEVIQRHKQPLISFLEWPSWRAEVATETDGEFELFDVEHIRLVQFVQELEKTYGVRPF